MMPMTAEEVLHLMKHGKIIYTVSKTTKKYTFYEVDFRGLKETIRVPNELALEANPMNWHWLPDHE